MKQTQTSFYINFSTFEANTPLSLKKAELIFGVPEGIKSNRYQRLPHLFQKILKV
jgi:hypothetical protein